MTHIEKKHRIGWVTDAGEYGQNSIIIFSRKDLTSDQWDNLSMMYEGQRLGYVKAILLKKHNIVRRIERNEGLRDD